MVDRDGIPAIGDRPAATQRLDKWLWFARVVKTRTQAASLVTEGLVRVNRVKIDKPSHTVRPGDVLTIGLRGRVRVLEVVQGGERRGGAPEAALLFKDLSPPLPPKDERTEPAREPGAGRPTKKDRREMDRFWGRDGDGDY